MTENQEESAFVHFCKAERRGANQSINVIEIMLEDVKGAKHDHHEGGDRISNVGEMIANLMLAKRHLEDARQRLGLAIKAWDGGKSAYKD